MGAIELVLDIALNQQHCEEMTDLVKLKDYLVETKSHLKAPFSPAAEALLLHPPARSPERQARRGHRGWPTGLPMAHRWSPTTPAAQDWNASHAGRNEANRPSRTGAPMQEEAGTETAANPPSPPPILMRPHADLPKIGHGADRKQQRANGTTAQRQGQAEISGRSTRCRPPGLTYIWSKLPPEVQNLTGAGTEEIDWK